MGRVLYEMNNNSFSKPGGSQFCAFNNINIIWITNLCANFVELLRKSKDSSDNDKANFISVYFLM